MAQLKLMKLTLAMLLFSACSFGASADPLPYGYFSISYLWTASSVPPPGHYQYKIQISSVGNSEIVMVPGYGMFDKESPVWREEFQPSAEQIAALEAFSYSHSDASRLWWERTMVNPVGGPTCQLVLVHLDDGATNVDIPCNEWQTRDEYRKPKNAFVDMIKKTVPPEVWNKLWTKMDAYKSAYEKSRSSPK